MQVSDTPLSSASLASQSPRGPVRGYEGYERASTEDPYPAYDYPPRPRFTLDRIIRGILLLATTGAILWLLWLFYGLVIYLISGVVLSYLLNPLVDRIEGWGLPRIPAILLTFLGVIGGVSLIITNLAPFVMQQVTELSQLISADLINNVAARIDDRLVASLGIQPGAVTDGVSRIFNTLFEVEKITETVGSVVDIFTDIFYAVLIIPFVTFFFLKDGQQIRQSLLRTVPNRYFEVTLAVIEKVETNIGNYFRGLLLQCFSVGVVASIVLSIVGLQYALAVGVFTGLANTIPYFGPAMGFLAGALVSIVETGNFSLIFGVFIAMAITQVADNIFFQPLIFSRAAKMHPLIILFVVLIGAQLGGIVGMLISIPLTATVRVGVEQVLWSIRNYRILRTA